MSKIDRRKFITIAGTAPLGLVASSYIYIVLDVVKQIFMSDPNL